MPSHTRPILTALVVLMLLVAGCTGAQEDGGDAGPANAEASFDGDDAATGDSGADRADETERSSIDAAAAVEERHLIRTGEIRLEVDDFHDAKANVADAARERGGFVSDSAETLHSRPEYNRTTGRVVLRVPRENFTSLYDAVTAEGVVLEATTNTDDVTEQVVDLEARLENLRAQRDQLRELYEGANETSDVLRVQRELSEVQSEIERLEAQLRSLRDRVAYSTLTVRLVEPVPEIEHTPTPEPPAWYDTGLLSAFLDSVHGVTVVVRALAVTVAYVAPYLLAFGPPVAGAYLLATRLQGRRRW